MSTLGPSRNLKLAFLTTDNRWIFNDYENPIPHFGPAPQGVLDGFTGLPGIEVHIVSSTRKPVGAPEKLADNIWFHSQYVPKIGWMRTAYQGCIRATRKTLREIQPDIVHGQGTESDCSISAIFSGFPNVLTIHGNMRRIARLERRKPFSYGWLCARLEALTIPRSDGVVCISTHTEQEVAGLAKRTWILPNAVDPSFFEINAQPPPDTPPRILCVGRIYPIKNQNTLIRSLDALARTHKLQLTFVGLALPEEPYGAEFLRLVGERPWCTSVGWAGRRELRDHLRTATLLVLPSLEDNCPMVVLEAMAAGVPVVASRVGGIPDLIDEGKTGWLCDPNDPASISALVERFLGNPEAARNMAQQARLRARQRFHPKVVAERHVEIYREVLSGRVSM